MQEDTATTTPIESLMLLSMSHLTPQALNMFVKFQIADFLADNDGRPKSRHEICQHVVGGGRQSEENLWRMMRLLVVSGVIRQENDRKSGTILYSLTAVGRLLVTTTSTAAAAAPRPTSKRNSTSSLACMIEHWTEEPMWKAWSSVPDAIASDSDPFVLANGVSMEDYYYSSNLQSLQYANDFVKIVSDLEIDACVRGFDWSLLQGKKTVVDMGGYRGAVLEAVAAQFPGIGRFLCLDLPGVIAKQRQEAAAHGGTSNTSRVERVAGDLLDVSTYPAQVDAIFMKHIVFCDWNEEDSLRILKNCHTALSMGGRLIIAEAVLPDDSKLSTGTTTSREQLQLYADALMLVAGRPSAKTETEWKQISAQTGFQVESVALTEVPTCGIVVLRKYNDDV